MLEKPSLSTERLVSCLLAHYGIVVGTLTLLPLGADPNASVYKAEALDKVCYFVKCKKGHHNNTSAFIARLLYNAGIENIIPPLQTADGSSIQFIDNNSLIVYPFIEGQNGFCQDLTDYQWMMLGKTLRQIHETEVPSLLQKDIRKETFSPQWRKVVKELLTQLRLGMTGTDEVANSVINFLNVNVRAIQMLVDRAEELGQELLGQELRGQPLKFVLCHSDFHAGNVLINSANSFFIVDWDEPILAPKERDLMFIGGGVANVWNKPSEEKFFYQGYGIAEVNYALLAYYRNERIIEDIALIGQQLLLTSEPDSDRQELFRQLTDMFKPRGVVEIAFSS